MKTLLAVINLPINSENFIEYTARMAEDLGMKLHLTYILNPSAYPLSTGITGDATQPVDNSFLFEKDNAHKVIKKKIAHLKENVPLRGSIDFSTNTGSTDWVIKQFVDKNKAHMVVLDSYDKSGIWTLGSINMDIALKVSCPAWIIPFEMPYQKFDKIIYATNYNETDLKTIKDLIVITKNISPQIIALHIAESSDFEEKAIEQGFTTKLIKEAKYDKLKVETLIEKEGEDLGEIINKYASLKKANLIVVLKENRNFLERIFIPSSTKKIIKESHLPVLVYQENKKK